jgi:hypothetical protein
MSYRFLSTILGIDANFTGNLGVGTTTPTNRLDVIGTSYFSTDMYVGQNHGIFFNGNGGYAMGLFSSGSDLLFQAGGAEKMRLTSSGNVGIGTTSPGAMLDIYHPTNGYASVGLQGYSGATKWFLTSGISGVTIQDFAIGNNNNGTSPKLVITSSGNVLIGTTTDVGIKLYVSGGIRANGGNGQVDVDPTSGALRFYDGSTFRGGFGTDAWATGGSAVNLTTYLDNGNYYIYSNSTASKLFTVLSTGQVGIGTTNPTAKLEVVSTNQVSRFVATNYVLYTSYNANSYDVGYIGNGSGTVSGTSANDFGFQASQNLVIATGGGTERMRIVSGGNVLIGTTTDNGNKLQVVGGAISLNQSGQNILFANNVASGTNGYNIFIGNGGAAVAGSSGDGSYNTSLGYDALRYITTGRNNTAIGVNSLQSNTTGSYSVAVGVNALLYNNGDDNVAIGSASMYNNASGRYNLAAGSISLYSNSSGNNNTALGFASLYSNTTGSNNTAVGLYSMNSNSSGNYNTALGYCALQLVNNDRNTGIGYQSLGQLTSGSYNTGVGMYSGLYDNSINVINTNKNSVFLGYQSKSSANGNENEIVIGYDAEGQGSNSAVLGNSSISKTVLRGNVLIGTTTDAGYKLDVNGTVRVSSTLTVNDLISAKNQLTVGDGSTASNSSINLLGVFGVSYQWNIFNDSNGFTIYSQAGVNALRLNAFSGAATFANLGGGGVQMVITNNNGTLSTAPIPTPTIKSFGAFQEDTTQTAASSNTGYGVKFTTPDISGHGVDVIGDPFGNRTYILFSNSGFYNIQFSFQFQNTNNQIEDVTVWLRKNGNNPSDDIPATAGFVSVPNSHGGTPGTIIAAWNYFVEAASGDFFQLVWSTSNSTHVTMEYYPAGSPPPSAASAILTVNQVN